MRATDTDSPLQRVMFESQASPWLPTNTGRMIISYESDPEAIPRADPEAASRARNCSVVTMAFA
jgi:hypothetical protein